MSDTPLPFPESDDDLPGMADVAGEELARIYEDEDPAPSVDDVLEAKAAADDEMARVLGQQGPAAQGEDEDWDVDWSPEQGLLEVGVHPRGILANVEKTVTSGWGGKPKEPAIKWTVTDVPTGRSVKKIVNLKGGNGIERLNIEFARAFGIEPEEKHVGNRTVFSLPAGKLKAAVGSPCSFRVAHFKGDNGLRDTLEEILPPSQPTDLPDLPGMPDYPEGEPF